MSPDSPSDSAWTVTADPAVVHRWRTGPRWYYVLAAMIESTAVADRCHRVATALGGLLQPSAPGQPHVTLWVLGHRRPTRKGTDLPKRRVVVHVGAPDTFASAAYLRVHSYDIAALRTELAAAAGRDGAWPIEDRDEPYTPHVTVGTYRTVVPLAQARDALADLPAAAPLRATAQVRLMAVDTRSPVAALHPVPDPQR